MLEKMSDAHAFDVTLSDRTKCECAICKANKLTRVSVPCKREQMGYVVKLLQSDGGGEYAANENAQVLSDFQKICLILKSAIVSLQNCIFCGEKDWILSYKAIIK